MASRLGIEEVRSDAEDDQHHDKDNVVFPPDGLEGDRVDERVEEDGGNRSHPCHCDALGSQCVRPDLAGIRDEKRCKSNIVACKEAEEEGYDSDTRRGVTGLSEGSREASNDDVAGQHGACGCEEECATAEFIHAECCCDGKDEVPDL